MEVTIALSSLHFVFYFSTPHLSNPKAPINTVCISSPLALSQNSPGFPVSLHAPLLLHCWSVLLAYLN
jgi:hypothetical protein